jgi:hypothetical protein
MKKELRDQALHCAAALLCLLPLALLPGYIGGALSGFLCGMIREVTEEGDPVSLASVLAALNSWKDLSAWAAGGALVGIIA